jgi:hypothetical protein
MDFKLRNPTSVKQITDTVSSVIPRYVYGAVKEQALSGEPTALPDNTPQFGGFEQQ